MGDETVLSQLSGPLCSIVLCVLAGIALRYALWYGHSEENETTRTSLEDQARDRQARDRIAELEQQLAAERNSQTTAQDDYRQLCEEFDRYRQDTTTRDAETRTRLTSMDELEATVLELQTQLTESTQAKADLTSRLEGAIQAAELSTTSPDEATLQRLEALSAELKTTSGELEVTKETLHFSKTQLETAISDKDALLSRVQESDQQLRSAEDHIASLQETIESYTAQRDSETTSFEATQSELSELTAALETVRTEKTELAEWSQSEISQLEARCQELEQQLASTSNREHELGEQVATLGADARFVDDLRHQLTGLQAAFQQRTADFQTTTDERDLLLSQLNESSMRLDESQRTIETAVEENTRLREQLAAAQTDAESIADERTQLASDLETIRQQQAKLEREVRISHAETKQLSNENQALIKELTGIRARKNEELAVAYEKIQSLETDTNRRVDEAHSELAAQFEAKEQELTNRWRQHEADVAVKLGAIESEKASLQERLQKEREEREQAFADELALRTESIRGDIEGQLDQLTAQVTALGGRVRGLQTEKEEIINGLHRERNLRTKAETEFSETSERMQNLETTNENMTIKLSQFERRMGSLVEELEAAERQLRDRDADSGVLRVENKELAAELERERLQRTQLERSLQVHAETLEKLRADSASLEGLLERQAKVQSSLQHHALQLRSATKYEDDFESTPADDVVVTPETPVAPSVYAFESDETETGMTRVDPILGTVFATPPKYRDNLKLISGVGDILQEKLNRLGIYTFEQIMRWDSHAIEEFSNILAFKDRIDREGWVQQAARLYKERYTMGRAA